MCSKLPKEKLNSVNFVSRAYICAFASLCICIRKLILQLRLLLEILYSEYEHDSEIVIKGKI